MPNIKPYESINWPYTDEESLEIAEEKLSDIRTKLVSNTLNPLSRQAYQEWEAEMVEEVKARTEFILENN